MGDMPLLAMLPPQVHRKSLSRAETFSGRMRPENVCGRWPSQTGALGRPA